MTDQLEAVLVDRAPEEEIPGPAERADPAAGRPAGSAAGDIWGGDGVFMASISGLNI